MSVWLRFKMLHMCGHRPKFPFLNRGCCVNFLRGMQSRVLQGAETAEQQLLDFARDRMAHMMLLERGFAPA